MDVGANITKDIDVGVVIGTYGDWAWRRLGEYARIEVQAIFGVPVVHVHGDTLASARNLGASRIDAEWLCFLDADDVLHEDYFFFMAQASGDLRAPSVQYVVDNIPGPIESLADRDIETMNPCVIGTLIRKSMFDSIGGFKEWPAWEDYALFLAAHRRGAVLEHVPDAIYQAWVNPEGRNNTVVNGAELFAQIKASA